MSCSSRLRRSIESLEFVFSIRFFDNNILYTLIPQPGRVMRLEVDQQFRENVHTCITHAYNLTLKPINRQLKTNAVHVIYIYTYRQRDDTIELPSHHNQYE